jgi:hypothetical protein
MALKDEGLRRGSEMANSADRATLPILGGSFRGTATRRLDDARSSGGSLGHARGSDARVDGLIGGGHLGFSALPAEESGLPEVPHDSERNPWVC